MNMNKSKVTGVAQQYLEENFIELSVHAEKEKKLSADLPLYWNFKTLISITSCCLDSRQQSTLSWLFIYHFF